MSRYASARGPDVRHTHRLPAEADKSRRVTRRYSSRNAFARYALISARSPFPAGLGQRMSEADAQAVSNKANAATLTLAKERARLIRTPE